MTQGGLNQGVGLLRVYGLGFSEESELYSVGHNKNEQALESIESYLH
jgi:hypothetical protein